MKAKTAFMQIGKIAFQGFSDCHESELIPRDLRFGKKPGFDGFMTGIERFASQTAHQPLHRFRAPRLAPLFRPFP